MCKQYGYCRISTSKQNIERQVRNILAVCPAAIIVKEVFTGTKFQGRKELDKILSRIKTGDTIIFDSVSRMSRNAEEGFFLYEELFNKGINLIFLKEPHINTDTYRKAVESKLQIAFNSGDMDTDELMGSIIEALNKYIMRLAKKQIQLAFDQAENKDDLVAEYLDTEIPRLGPGIESADCVVRGRAADLLKLVATLAFSFINTGLIYKLLRNTCAYNCLPKR